MHSRWTTDQMSWCRIYMKLPCTHARQEGGPKWQTWNRGIEQTGFLQGRCPLCDHCVEKAQYTPFLRMLCRTGFWARTLIALTSPFLWSSFFGFSYSGFVVRKFVSNENQSIFGNQKYIGAYSMFDIVVKRFSEQSNGLFLIWHTSVLWWNVKVLQAISLAGGLTPL